MRIFAEAGSWAGRADKSPRQNTLIIRLARQRTISSSQSWSPNFKYSRQRSHAKLIPITPRPTPTPTVWLGSGPKSMKSTKKDNIQLKRKRGPMIAHVHIAKQKRTQTIIAAIEVAVAALDRLP